MSALRCARLLLLSAPLTAAAADLHVSAGGTISSDSSLNAARDTQVVQVGGRLEFAGGWGLGLEGLLRRDDDPARQRFVGLNGVATRQESLGLDLRHSWRPLPRHRVGIGVSAGSNRLAIDEAGLPRYDEGGSYRAASVFYDFLPSEHLSMGLSARQQVDRMQQAYPDPAALNTGLNATGLNNIVYNPYAFPPRSYKTHLNSLAVNIGYRF